jgi:hypothetical protein
MRSHAFSTVTSAAASVGIHSSSATLNTCFTFIIHPLLIIHL